jgi:hypothetical protein
VISPIDRYINVPNIAEGLAQNASGGVLVDVPALGATVISNVSCIHAREIIVMATSNSKIKHVYLDIYGGSRTLVVTVLLGSVAAGTSALFQYTGGAGQTYDVRLVPDVGALVAQCWTCAR